MHWNNRWLNIVISMKIIIKISEWIRPHLLCAKFTYFSAQSPGYNVSANQNNCHCWHLYQLGISHSLYAYLRITTWEVKRKGWVITTLLQVFFWGDHCTIPDIFCWDQTAIFHGNLDHLRPWLRRQKHVFWAEPWCFPNQHQVVSVPRPKQTASTALWWERNRCPPGW